MFHTLIYIMSCVWLGFYLYPVAYGHATRGNYIWLAVWAILVASNLLVGERMKR